MGDKTESKDYLNDQHPAKFFAKEFIVPFGIRALEKEPNLDDRFLPQLKLEIKKLQALNFKNKNMQTKIAVLQEEILLQKM